MHKTIDIIYKKAAFYLLLAVFFVVLDVFLKNYALKNLGYKDYDIIFNFFKLSLAKNTGIAFSIQLPVLFLNIFIGFIIIGLIIAYIKEITQKRTTYILPLTFITIGAIINFVDRIRYGFVIDYFNLKWFTVFNIADVMIFWGAMIIILKNVYARKTR